MTAADDEPTTETLSPDDAFGVLGNETRMQILRVLGEADDSLAFSALHDAVDVRDSGQFNYHLDKLKGHFVRKTGDEYVLRQAGNRVVEAVLSGAMTESPVVEPTATDHSCPYCGAALEVAFREERVQLFCTECAGTYDRTDADPEAFTPSEYGHVGDVILPPAGVRGRTPQEMLRAAVTLGNLEFTAATSGICPRCSAPFEQSLTVCETHDADDGLCEDCGRRHATLVQNHCTNCTFGYGGTLLLVLLDEMPFVAFLVEHDVNPVAPPPDRYLALEMSYEEELQSVDPFEAQFSLTLEDDVLTVVVDDELTIVDVQNDSHSAPT
jgi:hypothetical protein